MRKGIVFDIKKYSIHDGPGIRTTIFLKGCPLNCWWCHNPESQELPAEIIVRSDLCIGCGECIRICPGSCYAFLNNKITRRADQCILCFNCVKVCHSGALERVGAEMTVARVMEEIAKDLVFYDDSGGGVTFSGGEPLVQFDFLFDLVRACKKIEVHTALDTTGHTPTENLLKLAEYIDLFLYDLKLMNPQKHKKYTGVDNQLLLNNLKYLARLNKNIIIRVPLIPGVNDDEENIDNMAICLSSLASIHQINLLPYFAGGVAKLERLQKSGQSFQIESLLHPHIETAYDIFEKYGFEVKVGG